jgi:sugar phosphate isomerase/epimerase
MNTLSRRHFLAAGMAALVATPILAHAIQPIRRAHPWVKGVALTSYSLRAHMKFWWGKPAQGTMDMLDFIEYCARLRFDAAEVTSYFFAEPVERSFAHEIRRRAHLLGVDINGGAIGNNFSHPPGSEAALRQLEYAKTWIDHFAEMGAPVVRIFAGNPPKGQALDETIRHVLANTTEALAHAEKRGIMLAMENHDFASNLDHLLRIVEAIDSKWFGVLFDSANLAHTEDPYADLARIAPYAIAAQLKAAIPVQGKPQPADFGRLTRILRDAGYSGYVTLEYEEAEDPFTAIPRYLEKLRRAVAEAA